MTKIFMAVVALFAVACTTDTTGDLAPELGYGAEGAAGPQTTLTLSLEESRTQLGDRAADGFYPLYWSENDAVAVNGTGYPVTINSENAAVATIPGVPEADEYCIAYPVAPAGQVLFAEKQNHVVEGDTFEDGVSTMYAYSESGVGVQLNHLTGILKFGITGSAKLSKLQVSTVNRDQIAGYFDFDFEKGELKESAGAKSVIEYSFGESGLQLSETAQYVHIAVPAGLNDGLYDELYVTLYEQGNSGNIMYATIMADTKTEEKDNTLKAGKVREFNKPIAYAPNAKLFVINSVAKLQEFKSAIESAEGLASDAIITEDIDMSEVADWEPINGENYVNTLIGNGYAIKGLKAPLFATTSASFKGVHLEDVAITTNDTPIMGALACTITATDEVIPTVKNCSVSGTFTVNNPTLASTSSVRYGALLGITYGAEISDCTNYATVTANVLYNSGSQAANLGGVVGAMSVFTKSDSTVLYSKIYNSTNNGAVSNEAACSKGCYIGGVIGASLDVNLGVEICSCTNNKEVSIASSSAGLFIGGVCGYAISNDTGTTSKNENYGNVTIKSGASISSDAQVGGLFGNCQSLDILNSYNKGTVHAEEGAMMAAVNMGGIVGLNTYKNSVKSGTITDTTNDGEVKFGASNPSATTSNTTRIAGITGYGQSSLTSVINNGTVTIYGTRNANGTISKGSNNFRTGSYVIAGIAGYKTEGKITDCENHGDIEIVGTLKELNATNKTEWKIAGIAGYLSTNLVGSCVCDGDIIVSGTIEGEANIGGKIAFTYADQDSETSNTNIIIKKGAVISGGAVIGGVISWTSMVSKNHVTNYGTITVEEGATIGTKCYIGGCVGMFLGIKTNVKTAENLKNHGTIKINGNLTSGGYVGGALGYVKAAADYTYDETSYKDCEAHIISNATNNGAISCGNTSSSTGANFYVGGVIGRAAGVKTATNNGKITIDGSHTGGNNYYAGCIADGAGDATGLTNNADLDFPSTSTFKTPRIGGLVGYNSNKVSGTNLGCINYSGTSTGTASIGGIAYRGTVVDCVNGSETDNTKGVITYNGAAGSSATSGSLQFGGIVVDPHGNCSGSTNYAPINIGGSSSHTMYGGGICQGAVDGGSTMSNCQNYGKVTVTATVGIPGDANRKGADFFFGTLGYAVAASQSLRSYVNCHNYGDIELTSDAKIAGAIRLGGLFGNLEEEGDIKENDTVVGHCYPYVSLDGCSNSGNIKISCQNSLGESSNFIIAGCISSYTTKSNLTIRNGLTNNGNITIDGENTGNYISIGGVFGTVGASVTSDFEGSIKNTGTIKYTGKSKTYLRIGGIVSLHSAPSFTVPMINTGNIECTGTWTTTNTDGAYIGGICGKNAKSIIDAQCFCEIRATENYYTGIGWITGSARVPATADAAGVIASNCKVGGKVLVYDEQLEDYNEKSIADKYYNYIYGSGSTTDWTGTENYDGCGPLNSAEEIVVPTTTVPGDTTTEGSEVTE